MPLKHSSKFGIAGKLLAGVIVLSATLWGAGFWDKKDFTQWNEKEVRKVLDSSPWAKPVAIPVPAALSNPGGRAGRGGGGGGGGGGGAARGGGGAGRGGGGGAQVMGAQTVKLVVRFVHALPMKQAIIKSNMGESTEPTPRMLEFLDHQEPYYIVQVFGLPAIFERFADSPENLVKTARLRRKGKDDILPHKVEANVVQGRFAQYHYFFPRDAGISLADKEVEFFMRFERSLMMGAGPRPGQARQGQGQGQRAGQGQQGQRQQQAQRPGGQGGQRPGGQGGQRPQGQGQRPGGGMNQRVAVLFGKDIKKKFRLKDMVYKGELAL